MSTSISVLLMKVAEARTSEEQYESALRLLAYNLPHLKTQQHQLPHLKQFIVDEDKPGTLKTLEALKERLYAFHSAHPHEANIP